MLRSCAWPPALATISAITGNLERAFHIGNTSVGDRLLVKGYIRARILVPAVCLLAMTPRPAYD